MLSGYMRYNGNSMFYDDLLYDAPVGVWPLDLLDAGVFTDQSGFDQDATFTGTPVFVEPVAGRGGAAVRLQTGLTITFPWNSAFKASKEVRSFSIEAWVKSETTVGTCTLGRNGKGIILTGNQIVFDLGGTNVISDYIEVGENYHVVASYNPTTMSLWINNELVAEQLVSVVDFSALTGNFTATVTSTRGVNLDTLAFYNYNLSAAIINRHYNNSVNYFSVSNNTAARAAIYFKFDDLHMPIARREVAQYGPNMTNMAAVDNQLQQIYDPNTSTYPAAVYTHLVQFDDTATGLAKQARIDWDVIGDPARVTVESSKDNSTWAPVTNHGMTTNWDDSMTNNDYFLRVTISSGTTQVAIEDLTVTMYKAIQYTSSDVNVRATVTSGTPTTGKYESDAGTFANTQGLGLVGGYMTVDPYPDFGAAGTVEMIVKPWTGTGTLFEQGSARIYRDGAGIHWTGLQRLVVDGVDMVQNDTTVKVGWRHVVAVLAATSSATATVLGRAGGTDLTAGTPRISHLAFYKEQMTSAQARNLYNNYTGFTSTRFLESTQVLVKEHAWPNGEPYRIYSFDWSIPASS